MAGGRLGSGSRGGTVIGLISYLFWRIARSDDMQDSIDFQDEYSGKSEPYPPIGR